MILIGSYKSSCICFDSSNGIYTSLNLLNNLTPLDKHLNHCTLDSSTFHALKGSVNSTHFNSNISLRDRLRNLCYKRLLANNASRFRF